LSRVLPVGTVSQVREPSAPRTQFSNDTPLWAGGRGKASRRGGSRRGRLAITGAIDRGRDIRGGRLCWDDGSVFTSETGMYTDWTAVILLLLTAAPLAAVVGTAAFFIWQQKKKQVKRF
jgi:hypothetical protein